jgi:hypothetical protein
LRFRGATAGTINGSTSQINSMVDRVREVLPHMPDELILEVYFCFCYSLVVIALDAGICTNAFSLQPHCRI